MSILRQSNNVRDRSPCDKLVNIIVVFPSHAKISRAKGSGSQLKGFEARAVDSGLELMRKDSGSDVTHVLRKIRLTDYVGVLLFDTGRLHVCGPDG